MAINIKYIIFLVDPNDPSYIFAKNNIELNSKYMAIIGQSNISLEIQYRLL